MSVYGYTREDQDKTAATIAAEYREAASLFPVIRKVFEQLDHKVYNCRIEKALSEATGKRIFSERRGSFLSFYYYGSRSRYFYLATMKAEDMPDGKRIDAEKLIEDARAKRADFLKRAAEIDGVAGRVDEIRKQVKQLQHALSGVIGPIPWEIREIWGLNYRITN